MPARDRAEASGPSLRASVGAPALLATAGFIYVLVGRKGFLNEVRYAAVLVVLGVAIYMVRAWRRKEWPVGSAAG